MVGGLKWRQIELPAVEQTELSLNWWQMLQLCQLGDLALSLKVKYLLDSRPLCWQQAVPVT